METLGMPELLVILGVAVLLFGGKKIPELAKGLGEDDAVRLLDENLAQLRAVDAAAGEAQR